MEFESIRRKVLDYGQSGYFLIESFIINLLKIHLESQKRTLIQGGSNTRLAYDALAPDGIDKISKPTYIEITASGNLEKLRHILKKTYAQAKENECALLIILTEPIDAKFFPSLEDIAEGFGVDLLIWGPSEIQDLINRHKEKAEELGEKLFTLRIKTAIQKDQKDWKQVRSEIVGKVKTAYRTGQFTLVLGAGVSSSAGLPDWNTLLNSLLVSLLTKELDTSTESKNVLSIVSRLRDTDEPSALMSARYLRKGFSRSGSTEHAEFISATTEQLYKLRDTQKPISSLLIKSVASLCMPGRTGTKVRSVITYNFDDLLERELRTREILQRSIFNEIDISTPEELPIYHVHGYLPEDRSQYKNIEYTNIVFSEEGYHRIYNDPYHWSNLVQLNHLRETTCLMIGLSMTDPNLRRLLEISSRSIEQPKHYALMRRVSDEKFMKERGKKVVDAPSETVRKFLDRHHSLNEEVLKELGVNVLWYESYDEIPEILNSLLTS